MQFIFVFVMSCAPDTMSDTGGATPLTVQVEPGGRQVVRVDDRDWAVTVVPQEEDACFPTREGGSMCPTLDLSAYHVEDGGFLTTSGYGLVVNDTRRTWSIDVW